MSGYDASKATSRLNGWMRLLRPPNLFTVPGDVAAGFFLAGGLDYRMVLPLMLAALSAYIFGLLTNDLADRETDRIERPDRPIPSGAVSVPAVWTASVCAAVCALVFAAGSWLTLTCCTGLLLCIGLYNFLLKGKKFRGSFFMGLCRFLSVFLGICAVSFQPFGFGAAAAYAVGTLIYIAGITIAAEKETELLKSRPGGTLMLSGALLAYLTLFVVITLKKMDSVMMISCGIFSAVCAAIFLLLAYWGARIFKLGILPKEIQRWIGILIWNLLFLQAAALSAMKMLYAALILIGFAFLAKGASRKFYGS